MEEKIILIIGFLFYVFFLCPLFIAFIIEDKSGFSPREKIVILVVGVGGLLAANIFFSVIFARAGGRWAPFFVAVFFMLQLAVIFKSKLTLFFLIILIGLLLTKPTNDFRFIFFSSPTPTPTFVLPSFNPTPTPTPTPTPISSLPGLVSLGEFLNKPFFQFVELVYYAPLEKGPLEGKVEVGSKKVRVKIGKIKEELPSCNFSLPASPPCSHFVGSASECLLSFIPGESGCAVFQLRLTSGGIHVTINGYRIIERGVIEADHLPPPSYYIYVDVSDQRK